MSKQLTKTNTTTVTKQLKHWFDLLGWPQTLLSDGGPQFWNSTIFATKNNSTHELHNPQVNDLAESAVKNAKHLLITPQFPRLHLLTQKVLKLMLQQPDCCPRVRPCHKASNQEKTGLS